MAIQRTDEQINPVALLLYDGTKWVPFTATSLTIALPTDAATETTLSALLTELGQKTEPTDTQPISAASLPLPSGASTAALQTQPGTDIGDVTINNASGGSAVNIQDGGNAITVDGSLTTVSTVTTVTNLSQQGGVAISLNTGVRDTGTQRVTIATNDVVPVTDNGGALTIDFAGVAPPIGGGTEATALKVTVASDSTGVLSVDDNGSSLTVDGTAVNPATYFGKTLTYVSVAQGAAGATQLAAASGAAKHKVLGCCLVMDAAGTLKFNDSSGDLTGAMAIAANGGFVLPTSMLPYCETGAVNRSISITTATGKAAGVVVLLTEA